MSDLVPGRRVLVNLADQVTATVVAPPRTSSHHSDDLTPVVVDGESTLRLVPTTCLVALPIAEDPATAQHHAWVDANAEFAISELARSW
jgi:hypothetical protein